MLDEETLKALNKAVEAFYKYLDDEDLDGAYWDVMFTAYELDKEFNRWKRATVEENLGKKIEEVENDSHSNR